MKFRSLLIFLILLDSVTFIEVCAFPISADHLIPFGPSIYDELRPSLYRKLCVTPANYGRMIVLPSGPERGEWAVSIHCSEGSVTGTECYVTLTRTKANLDYIMQQYREKDPLKLVNRVGVVRKDAPIQRSTALAIRAAWLGFLQNVEPGVSRPNDRIVLDGEIIEFWITRKKETARKGEVPDNPGKSVIAFIALGRLLAKYCETPEHQRPEVAARIELDAKHLAARMPN